MKPFLFVRLLISHPTKYNFEQWFIKYGFTFPYIKENWNNQKIIKVICISKMAFSTRDVIITKMNL